MRASVPRALVFVASISLLASMPAPAEAQGALTRIALYAPQGRSQDPTLEAALATVADSVELSLVVMQRYDVRRLPPADPDTEIATVRSYCSANHIDQAILGSGSEKPNGGFDFRLLVYDRKSDSISVDKRGSSAGALDMFDITDALVASLLEGLSGTHLLFGSLTVDTDPAGAAVAVGGKDVGAGPVSLRGLPVGSVQITARSAGYENAQASATIADGDTASVLLKLARSTGTLSVQMPADGQLAVAGAEIGTRQLTGPGALTLPTGSYQLTATSAGLAKATGQLTVARNTTSSWLPWPKGYLDLQTAPAGAAISVDGAARGSTPQVIEVEPGTLHRVTLTKDTYQAYVADVSSAAGDKTRLSPELSLLPGSIRVETSLEHVERGLYQIAAAQVSLDGGEDHATPYVFQDVPAGVHQIKISDVKVDNRIFTAGPAFTAQVTPAQTTVVTRQLVQGTAHLRVLDAPPGTTVQVDGNPADSSAGLDNGIEIPAGEVSVSLTAPNSQKWTKTIDAGVGSSDIETIEDMTWHILRKSMPSNGAPADWAGILPLWSSGRNSFFKDQPGTQIARGYLVEDDKRLYARFIFSDGTPVRQLAKVFTQVLGYSMYFYPADGSDRRLEAHVRFVRSGSGSAPETSFGVFNPSTGNWTDLGGASVSYQVGDSELVMSVPLDPLRSFVKGRILQADLFVSSEPVNGPWFSSNETGRIPVDFGF